MIFADGNFLIKAYRYFIFQFLATYKDLFSVGDNMPNKQSCHVDTDQNCFAAAATVIAFSVLGMDCNTTIAQGSRKAPTAEALISSNGVKSTYYGALSTHQPADRGKQGDRKNHRRGNMNKEDCKMTGYLKA
ncbi:unnamed protein product [Sphenostylis stenocarpa]|uniref:Uncharacterized protein n=1 Tax=Sphenostylis stenocarpa TaxID=92480 RepID=A0AA87B6N8_9FABA|nr:unnamed protein product [Sphenostylis stenocarpa]